QKSLASAIFWAASSITLEARRRLGQCGSSQAGTAVGQPVAVGPAEPPEPPVAAQVPSGGRPAPVARSAVAAETPSNERLAAPVARPAVAAETPSDERPAAPAARPPSAPAETPSDARP